MLNFNDWFNSVIGKALDIDGAFGDQCVDVAMSWAQYCFPSHKWPELLGYGDAKDIFNSSNATYFDKLTSTPQQGDMVIFGATSTNPYGHIAVIVSVTATNMTVIEQNGFNPSGVTYTAQRPYNNIVGYLRPKINLTKGMIMVDKNMLNNLYQGVLRRQPDHPAADGFIGQPADVVLQDLLDSAEYKALVAADAANAAELAKLRAQVTTSSGLNADQAASLSRIDNSVQWLVNTFKSVFNRS